MRSRLPKPSREGWTRCRQCGKSTPPTPICASCNKPKGVVSADKTVGAFKGTQAAHDVSNLASKFFIGDFDKRADAGQLMLLIQSLLIRGKLNLSVQESDGKSVELTFEDLMDAGKGILKTWYDETGDLNSALEKERKKLKQLLLERAKDEGEKKEAEKH